MPWSHPGQRQTRSLLDHHDHRDPTVSPIQTSFVGCGIRIGNSQLAHRRWIRQLCQTIAHPHSKTATHADPVPLPSLRASRDRLAVAPPLYHDMGMRTRMHLHVFALPRPHHGRHTGPATSNLSIAGPGLSARHMSDTYPLPSPAPRASKKRANKAWPCSDSMGKTRTTHRALVPWRK